MIKNLVKTRLPTGFGDFSLYLYLEGGKEHLALVKGHVDLAQVQPVPVRVHSECLTGDVFGSRRCDCGDQLKHALMYLGRQDAGVLIYLRQEGRGIGLFKKMEAYNLQDQGLDTVEANLQLGHQPDERDYGIAARILRSLGVASIRLMTNNPHKVEELESHGIEVASRIPIEVGHHEENLGYLRSKAERMAHLLRFRGQSPENQECLFFDPLIDHLAMVSHHVHPRPFVTLAYAQSMDGVLLASEERGDALPAVRYLSSHHDAVMTIASHLEGLIGCSDPSKRLILWDPELRVLEKGLDSEIGCEGVWVLTVPGHPIEQHRSIEARGMRVIVVTQSADGVPEFGGVLEALAAVGVRTLLVAGNEALVAALLYNRSVDYCVMTLVAHFLGRHHFASGQASVLPEFTECAFHELSGDMVAFGPISYAHSG